MTDEFQPLDRRVFGCMKEEFRRTWRQYVNSLDEDERVKVNRAKGTELLLQAWANVKVSTVLDAWSIYWKPAEVDDLREVAGVPERAAFAIEPSQNPEAAVEELEQQERAARGEDSSDSDDEDDEGEAFVRPWNGFLQQRRNAPEFAGVAYSAVVKQLAVEWRELSAAEKAAFGRGRRRK